LPGVRRTLLPLAAILLVVAGCGSSKRTFSANVTNPWYPLKPGSVYVYRGVKDGKPSREVMTVTDNIRVIDGAPARAIDDRLFLSGALEEKTTDWYTQDNDGNVWYYGEKTAELDPSGKVTSTEGSWLAGVNGAKPGIFMYANPKVGQSARQEYYQGHAEDHFEALQQNVHVTVPYMSASQALLTKEWTPLEPGTLDHKYYARGVGTVLEQSVKGPVERNALTGFFRRGQ
jgi:hypothetical protein